MESKNNWININQKNISEIFKGDLIRGETMTYSQKWLCDDDCNKIKIGICISDNHKNIYEIQIMNLENFEIEFAVLELGTTGFSKLEKMKDDKWDEIKSEYIEKYAKKVVELI